MSAFVRIALACLALSLSPWVLAQQVAPAPASSTGGMDMSSMPGMDHPHDAETDMSAVDHGRHGMDAMPHTRMQGGAAPPDARSADDSDGTGDGAMPGMEMRDAEPLGMLRFDQLEAFDGLHADGTAWEMEGWYGTDTDKLRLRSEGQRDGGRFDDSDAEALWSHAVAAYWDTELGVRSDFGSGPARQWLAFGVQGLAPYWFELAATAYAGQGGRTAARLRADYELRITQRWILQPEWEVNLYGRDDPQRRLGSGLSDASFGLRLRYEIRRQFAPYLGVVWTQRFGGTATFARDGGGTAFDRRLVAGLRFWF
ncbi:MAG: copper resistance protein B [Rhodanobacter sp.]